MSKLISSLNVGDTFIDWLGEFYVLQRIEAEKRKLHFMQQDPSEGPSARRRILTVEGSLLGISAKEDPSGNVSSLTLEVQWASGTIDSVALVRRTVAKPDAPTKTFWEHLEEG